MRLTERCDILCELAEEIFDHPTIATTLEYVDIDQCLVMISAQYKRGYKYGKYFMAPTHNIPDKSEDELSINDEDDEDVLIPRYFYQD
jgi:hypothetical protein